MPASTKLRREQLRAEALSKLFLLKAGNSELTPNYRLSGLRCF
eukprot:COSAG02_NODE_4098_length_5781_cov_13.744984_8_plen_43_part_00